MSTISTFRTPFIIGLLLAGAGFLLVGCSKQSGGGTSSARSYRMGFMSSAPRPDITLYLEALAIWPVHSDATIVSVEVPWDSLLNGESAATYINDNFLAVVNYCRGQNLKLWIYIDPENGLNRSSDSDPLVARGKSIAQTDIQQTYRLFCVAMDSMLHPDHLGLALETNLIRLAAPAPIYQGVRQAANAAAADIRARDAAVPLSVSIQAEVAWGKLGGTGFVGITQDFTDFPFVQELGISSYPYLSFTNPADIPLNYYSQLVATNSLPVFVSEGGWSSMGLLGSNYVVSSSLAQQRAYIARQGQLLAQAHAIALFQLTFTDLDIAAWPATDTAGLYPFAFLGMVDSNLVAKPAFSAWDSLRAQPLQAGH